MLNLGSRDLPQLVDGSRFTSDGTLGNLDGKAENGLIRERVCGGVNLDADDTNARVVLRSVVLAIAEVAHPRLETLAVVLLHDAAVCLNGGLAGDRGPLPRTVDEADVDLGIALQLVCLVGLGIGEEEQVGAIGLLEHCQSLIP